LQLVKTKGVKHLIIAEPLVFIIVYNIYPQATQLYEPMQIRFCSCLRKTIFPSLLPLRLLICRAVINVQLSSVTSFNMAATRGSGGVEMVDSCFQQQQFQYRIKDLQDLMQSRGMEGVVRLQQEFGGVIELCRRLYTSPTEGRLLQQNTKRL
jgi:hypothetical protein